MMLALSLRVASAARECVFEPAPSTLPRWSMRSRPSPTTRTRPTWACTSPTASSRLAARRRLPWYVLPWGGAGPTPTTTLGTPSASHVRLLLLTPAQPGDFNLLLLDQLLKCPKLDMVREGSEEASRPPGERCHAPASTPHRRTLLARRPRTTLAGVVLQRAQRRVRRRRLRAQEGHRLRGGHLHRGRAQRRKRRGRRHERGGRTLPGCCPPRCARAPALTPALGVNCVSGICICFGHLGKHGAQPPSHQPRASEPLHVCVGTKRSTLRRTCRSSSSAARPTATTTGRTASCEPAPRAAGQGAPRTEEEPDALRSGTLLTPARTPMRARAGTTRWAWWTLTSSCGCSSRSRAPR